MNFDYLNQVINIEHVGPHQIQTTSLPSTNFSVLAESFVDVNVICIESKEANNKPKE